MNECWLIVGYDLTIFSASYGQRDSLPPHSLHIVETSFNVQDIFLCSCVLIRLVECFIIMMSTLVLLIILLKLISRITEAI